MREYANVSENIIEVEKILIKSIRINGGERVIILARKNCLIVRPFKTGIFL